MIFNQMSGYGKVVCGHVNIFLNGTKRNIDAILDVEIANNYHNNIDTAQEPQVNNGI